MKKLFLIIALSIFTGTISCFSQIDSSALKSLQNKFKEIEDLSHKANRYKVDILRYNRLLKNKDITTSEFNDLIKGIKDLLKMNEPIEGNIYLYDYPKINPL